MSKKSLFEKHYENFKKSKGIGSLITIDDVSAEDMAKIVGEMYNGSKDDGDIDRSYIRVLSKYGIICPHPHDKRLYSGTIKSVKVLKDHVWYKCVLCDCLVINNYQRYSLEDYKASGE